MTLKQSIRNLKIFLAENLSIFNSLAVNKLKSEII